MALPNRSFRPESHAQTYPAVGRTTSDYELANDWELASSQPVSLIQLCTKPGHSRNTRTRRARAVHSNSVDDMAPTQGSPAFHRVDKCERFARLPLPSYSNPAEYGPGDEPGHTASPPRIVSQEYPWQQGGTHTENVQEQTWEQTLSNYHTQKNPLNYASNHTGSQSRQGSYMSESPFLKNPDSWDIPCSERATGPASMTPVVKQSPIDASQSNHYTQAIPRKEYMTVSSLQLYRDSFDHPHDRSPYESFRLRHRNNRTDLPEINSGLQFGYAPDLEYGKSTGHMAIRSEPSFGIHSREQLSNSEALKRSREDRKTHKPQDAPSSRLSSGTSISQRTLKEEIYAILDNMNVGFKTDPKSTLTQNSEGSEHNSPSALDQDPPAQPLRAAALPLYGTGSGDIETQRKGSESQSRNSGEELAERKHEVNPTETPDTKPGQSNIEPNIHADRGLERPSAISDAPLERIIKPPPGLSKPEISSLFRKKEKRLLDAERWFHQHTHGQVSLHQQTVDFAENIVDKYERFGGKELPERDHIFAKQYLAVVGRVIANFRAYRPDSPTTQTGYFTNFEPVVSGCRDLPLDGQRSAIDDPWNRCMEGKALGVTAISGKR
ncbi:hypothetical protein BDW62DRAFT_152360 [Aspergillus aurantiobrunneus]